MITKAVHECVLSRVWLQWAYGEPENPLLCNDGARSWPGRRMRRLQDLADISDAVVFIVGADVAFVARLRRNETQHGSILIMEPDGASVLPESCVETREIEKIY